MANKGSGLDWQGRRAILFSGKRKGFAFQALRCALLDDRASSPIGKVTVGLSGRDLTLKYSKVPAVPDWQLAKLMDFEVQEIAGQAGESLASDYNLLPASEDLSGEDTILLALAKTSVLEERVRKVGLWKGAVEAFTPDPIALYNAFLAVGPVEDEKTKLLAWIGETSLDLCLVRGGSLLFVRTVSGGLGILDQAIAGNFNVREERAVKIRNELLNLDPAAKGSYGSSQEEKVAHAVAGVSGQILAALRSTLAFCRSQIQIQDLELDDVLCCGPGAKVRGMDRFLAEGLQAPVKVWNPVIELDLGALPPEEGALCKKLGPEIVLALGLAAAPCFDELYAMEILPEAVKRKRRFLTRTVFTIATLVLALVYLGAEVSTLSETFEKTKRIERSVVGKVKRIRGLHERTLAEIRKNDEMRAELEVLAREAVPLHGTVRLLRAMRETLPQDFWIRKIKTFEGPAPWAVSGKEGEARRAPKRPLLSFKGSGKPVSGRPIESVYAAFKKALSAKVPKLLDSTTSSRGFRFEGTVDFLAAEAATGEENR